MNKLWFLLAVTSTSLSFPPSTAAQILLESDSLRIEIQSDGQITALSSRESNTNYLALEQPAPLLTVRRDGALYQPTAVSMSTLR